MQPPTPSVQRSCDIYYRHMGAQGRGSPLWIPGPSKNLSIEYQRQGIGIGDVGILTVLGGFAFLFNICLPHDHPMQSAELPENFTPFLISQVDVEKQSEFLTDSHLASASIERSRRDGDSSGLVFESSASEGAILTMPLGSTSEDLGNVIRLRRYVAANAASWYRYVYEVRGREVMNGDLRLVAGYDKSRAWGMATFSNSTAQKDESFRLKFRPLEQTDVGRTYGWEYSGTAQVRAGPDIREIEALRMGDPLEEGLEYENQCLFVRTMNVDLPDKFWKELASELNIQVGLRNSDFFTSPSTQEFAGNGNSSNPSTFTPSNYTETRITSRTADINVMPLCPAHTMHLPPAAMAGHPSKVINKMLLENAKMDVRMVITEDKDWISVLTKVSTFQCLILDLMAT
ncbi:hypothetical protein BDZ97DRAFT_687183 [Flammula alnicola]|nr:hypothetical protein BDZ97DRAFT_687183 [Flammula alnicola]